LILNNSERVPTVIWISVTDVLSKKMVPTEEIIAKDVVFLIADH
jgi:hypothetical protein